MPNPAVYSYRTDVYRNGSASLLLVCRIAKAEYVVLSHGAFLRAVQYGLMSCFAHDHMKSACAAQGALLRVPWVLVGEWFRYGIFEILKDMKVDPVLALLATGRAAEAYWNAKPD